MSAPTPTWYDLLGIEPDASPEEVRAAWRAAIADLDPTDRRFGVLNGAAEVLLDPAARATYDAELTDARPQPEPELAAEAEADEPVVGEADESLDDESDESDESDEAPWTRWVVPGWLLAGVAAVTLLVAGAALFVATTMPSDQAVEDASGAARSAAERAIVPVLSYDGTNLDASRAAATPYLTSDYRKKYDRLMDGAIAENAPSTGTVLTAKLLRSGIARADENRARVFLLVDQSRINKVDKKPVVYQNWVTVTMEKVGGEWLVADLQT